MVTKSGFKSLRTLVIIIVAVSVLAFALIFSGIFYNNVPGMLLQAENRYLEKQLEVVNGLFKDARRNAFNIAEDIGVRDGTVRFILGENPGYIAENWPEASLLDSYHFNFIIIKDAAGNDLYTEFLDFSGGPKEELPEGFSEFLRPFALQVMGMYRNPQIRTLPAERRGKGGLVIFAGEPYFVAVMPAAKSHGLGSPVGTVTLGLHLNDQYFKNLTHYYRNKFEILPMEDDGAPPASSIIRQQDTVSTAVGLKDINGSPLLLCMTDTRAIYTAGTAVINQTMVLLVAALLLFALALYFAVYRLLIRPMESISEDLKHGSPASFLRVDKYSRRSEFISLCRSINTMLRKFNRSQISLDVLQRILNGTDLYLYVSDAESDEILFMNDNMARHYGLDGSPVGQTCWEVLREGSAGRCELCPNETLLKNRDQVLVWEEKSQITGRYYRNTCCLITWSNGKPAHLQHRVDITDIKEAELSLQKRLKQQELMSILSQNFISTENIATLTQKALDITGQFMEVSKILLGRYNAQDRSLHFTSQWLNPNSSGLLITPENDYPLPEGDLLYQGIFKERAPYLILHDFEYEPLRKIGTRSMLCVPVLEDDEILGLLSFEQCQGEQQWTESDIQLGTMIGNIISGAISRSLIEEKLVRMSSIVGSSPQAITYSDENGYIEYFNQGVLEMSGYGEEELRGAHISRIFPPNITDYLMETVVPQVLEKGRMQVEVPFTRKDGKEIILSLSVFRIQSRGICFGTIASDISEKINLEKELVLAKEQAEESNQAKGEFLSRMSHEIRTPLNAIIGMTKIGQSAQEREKKEYCLEKIDSASTHLLGVINDILDISKIEAKKFELSFSDFSFENMLMRVYNVVNFKAEEKKQTLVINIGRNMPFSVIADEQRLAQVITNLLGNAIKFTPEGGEITLSARQVSEKNGFCTIEIRVTDTGIGISREQQEKLFSAFQQADASIAGQYGGTGLGLAISRNIVEMMGGRIWIESDLGNGATFAFTVVAQRGEGSRQSLLSPDVNWGNLRIMAVDDAPEVLEYFQDLSENLKIDCLLANNGLEACQILEEQKGKPLNIVFADWKMPGMDGIELASRIKSEYGGETVVIMISATEWNEIEREAKKAGVDHFIPKPLFSSVIVDCINQCLDSGKKSRSHHPEQDMGEPGAFSQYRVLLAEDIDINREIVYSLLEESGLNIDSAANGREAFEMFQASPGRYQMIFMDIHMPEVDGYEATALIRGLGSQEARNIPIVAMTANVFREDIEKCLAAGMNDHIGKPISLNEMLEKLTKYLPKEEYGPEESEAEERRKAD
ncbi:response regulator [Desulfovibrio sp. OttesenSCG-928-C14]|nr:response regulator [Desulfovibrio sp. OttesenSCG-928-C14]